MKNTLILLCVALVCTPVLAEQDASASVAAASAPAAVSAATGQSRIRMYGQNGRYSQIFPGLSCTKTAWSSEGILVSGGMGRAFLSFLRMGDNVSLGMPETDDSKNVSRKNGILSKAYYQEHVIPSGQVTSLAMAFNDVASKYGCSIGVSFMPEAGADYEVNFWQDNDRCYTNVSRLKKVGDETEVTPVPIEKVKGC